MRVQRTAGAWVSYYLGDILNDAVIVWVLMLLVGGMHHEISPAIPALGFWQVVLIYLTGSFLITPLVASGVKIAIRSEIE